MQRQITRAVKKMTASTTFFKALIYCYPPYWGTGVRIKSLSHDYRDMELIMPLRFYNKNYFGTQFGGSLYAMSDPFYCLMLSKNLGREYIVWDKAASIDFIKTGTSLVSCKLSLSQAIIDDIKTQAAKGKAVYPQFTIEVFDTKQQLISRIEKTLYVRLKNSL